MISIQAVTEVLNKDFSTRKHYRHDGVHRIEDGVVIIDIVPVHERALASYTGMADYLIARFFMSCEKCNHQVPAFRIFEPSHMAQVMARSAELKFTHSVAHGGKGIKV